MPPSKTTWRTLHSQGNRHTMSWGEGSSEMAFWGKVQVGTEGTKKEQIPILGYLWIMQLSNVLFCFPVSPKFSALCILLLVCFLNFWNDLSLYYPLGSWTLSSAQAGVPRSSPRGRETGTQPPRWMSPPSSCQWALPGVKGATGQRGG